MLQPSKIGQLESDAMMAKPVHPNGENFSGHLSLRLIDLLDADLDGVLSEYLLLSLQPMAGVIKISLTTTTAKPITYSALFQENADLQTLRLLSNSRSP